MLPEKVFWSSVRFLNYFLVFYLFIFVFRSYVYIMPSSRIEFEDYGIFSFKNIIERHGKGKHYTFIIKV